MPKALTLLQTACFRADVSVSQLLRAAILVASALSDRPSVESFSKELKGYDVSQGEPPDFPKFRLAHCRVMATDRWGRQVPVFFPDAESAERLSMVPVIQGTIGLEALLQGVNETGYFVVEFGPKTVTGLLESMPNAVNVYRQVQPAQFRTVLEELRQVVFDWCLSVVSDGRVLTDGPDLSTLLPPSPNEVERLEPMVAPTGVTVSANNSSVVIHSPGATSSASVSSHAGITQDELKALIGSLEGLLAPMLGSASNDADLIELRNQVDELKQLSSISAPRKTWVQESLRSVRSILENASGSLLATVAGRPEVLATIHRLLS